ncbi:Flavin-dependent monooxygenase [Psilocybe cubensis]|uniref:Flavin-dependent monooxygenase n=2 Tax=Psilocybe cubensis TaxID=181762 RepID=A0ACB8GRN3_PSICU|nr:Flavin-dependent monooxygenase [Psilocybe cubensis]KAH9478017.1 Flavin-dependent monooxygenase [Psilocybe cubensis]
MNYTSPEILIVGGGPSGLILALSLARNNVPVRLIEKSTTERVGQRGSGISPRTFEVFESLGVVDDVLKQVIKVPNFCVFKMPGGTEIINDFNMEEYVDPTPSIPYPNLMLLGQDLLDKILCAELAKHQCCQIDLGAELQSLKQWEDRVEVVIIRHDLSQDTFDSIDPVVAHSSPEDPPVAPVVEHASYK